jgi:hypothetical protein
MITFRRLRLLPPSHGPQDETPSLAMSGHLFGHIDTIYPFQDCSDGDQASSMKQSQRVELLRACRVIFLDTSLITGLAISAAGSPHRHSEIPGRSHYFP